MTSYGLTFLGLVIKENDFCIQRNLRSFAFLITQDQNGNTI